VFLPRQKFGKGWQLTMETGDILVSRDPMEVGIKPIDGKTTQTPSPRFTDCNHHISMPSPEPTIPSKKRFFDLLPLSLFEYSDTYLPIQ